MPKRIQRRRSKGWRMPEGAVYVGRPTRWGNPCCVGMDRGYGPADATYDFRRWLERDSGVRSFEGVFGKPPTPEEIESYLRGKDLVCWCPLDQPCHADVLLELANAAEAGLDGAAAPQRELAL